MRTLPILALLVVAVAIAVTVGIGVCFLSCVDQVKILNFAAWEKLLFNLDMGIHPEPPAHFDIGASGFDDEPDRCCLLVCCYFHTVNPCLLPGVFCVCRR